MKTQTKNKTEVVRDPKPLHVDSKGRISIGKFADGVDSFIPKLLPTGAIILEPMVSIPAREAWLFKNKAALESVQRGLRQSMEGRTVSLGSFAKFANEDIE